MVYEKVIILFKTSSNTFSDTYKLEWENASILFSGNYLIVETNNGDVGEIYPLEDIISYKYVGRKEN